MSEPRPWPAWVRAALERRYGPRTQEAGSAWVFDEIERGLERFVGASPVATDAQERVRAVLERVFDLFPPTPRLRTLIEDFDQEVRRGLEETGSSLKMLRTFARQPTGRETGRIVVVDWGGTNARAELVVLDGAGGYSVEGRVQFAFEARHKSAPAAEVFDVLSDQIARLLQGERGHDYALALIYSFPARLVAIDHAVALQLTKGWRPRGLEGENLVPIFRAALLRQGLDHVHLCAVANDTVAPMVLHTYQLGARQPDVQGAEVGLILGTGTNQALDLGQGDLRNMESGGFDGVRSLHTAIDHTVDQELADPPPGKQLYEKLVSGQYLGEIVRREILSLRISRRGLEFGGDAFERRFGIDTRWISQVAADTSTESTEVERLLKENGVAVSHPLERRLLQWLIHAVVQRSARLVAVGILGALRSVDPEERRPHCVAIDGSLYGGYPGYDALLRDALDEIGGQGSAARVERVFVKDSTAAGAAVIAAVARGQER